MEAYVAPNPAKGTAKLIVNTSSTLPINFQVIDMLGRNYKTVKLSKPGTNAIDIPISATLPGNYIILLNQGSQSTRAKMFVE